MKILILNCDIDENKETNLGYIINKHCKDAVIFDVYKNKFPSKLNYDKIIITGSEAHVYENREWIVKLEKLINEIDNKKIPTLAICFGMQAVTEALGGQVKRSLDIEYGFKTIQLNSKKINVYEHHHDAVTKMPNGSIELSRNDFSLQAYKIRNFLCLQFHPEITLKEAVKSAKEHNRVLDTKNASDDGLKILLEFIEFI